ncbi:MAG: hypothetical protein MZU91_04810 [Desulfosudis oleivorans]|nr:hypothetical protein [Desulfosudis oleivorans]
MGQRVGHVPRPSARLVQRSGRVDRDGRDRQDLQCDEDQHRPPSSSAHHDGVDPAGDFVGPRTSRDRRPRGLPGRRSTAPSLADLFAIGGEIVWASTDLADLEERVGRCSRQARGDGWRWRSGAGSGCSGDHTYEVRMEEMLHFVADNVETVFGGSSAEVAGREALVEEAGA